MKKEKSRTPVRAPRMGGAAAAKAATACRKTMATQSHQMKEEIKGKKVGKNTKRGRNVQDHLGQQKRIQALR